MRGVIAIAVGACVVLAMPGPAAAPGAPALDSAEWRERSLESAVATLPAREHREQIVVGAIVTAYTSGQESSGKHPGDPGYGITARKEARQWGRRVLDVTILASPTGP